MSEKSFDKARALLIQKDADLSNLIYFSLQSNFNFEVLESKNKVDTVKLTYDTEGILAVIYDADLGLDLFNELVTKYQTEGQSIPFFVTNADDEQKQSFSGPGAVEHVSKGDTLLDLNEKIKSYFKVDEGESRRPYCEISIKTLISFLGLEDDIYIKLSSGRFLKLFSVSDKITDEDVEKYKNKNVETLFLQKETSRWILSEFNKDFSGNFDKLKEGGPVTLDPTTKEVPPVEASEVVPEVEQVPPEEQENTSTTTPKSEIVAPQLKERSPEEIEEEVKQRVPLSEELEENIFSLTKKTTKALMKNNKLADHLKKLKVNRDDDEYMMTHIKLLCRLSCGIAAHMDWDSEKTFEKLIYCAYMHDITLADYPNLWKIHSLENLEKMEDELLDEHKDIFLKHPQAAADLILEVDDPPQDAETIILQHQERPDRSGFPNKLSHQRITPLSSLFIISHDLTDYIISNRRWKIGDFIKKNIKVYTGPHFKKILRALETFK